MASYKAHILCYGIFIFIMLAILNYYHESRIPITTLLIGISVGILYSILPDIDAKMSKIRQLVFLLSVLCFISYLVYPKFIIGLIAVVFAFFLLTTIFVEHRGFFHTIIAGVLFSIPLFLIDPWFSFFGFFGFLIHLAVDGKLFCLF